MACSCSQQSLMSLCISVVSVITSFSFLLLLIWDCSLWRPGFDSWLGKIHWRRDRLPTPVLLGFAYGSAGKESTCNAEDLGLTPWLGRSPGEGKGYPLQYSGLEKSMDYTVHWGHKGSDTTEQLSLHFRQYRIKLKHTHTPS